MADNIKNYIFIENENNNKNIRLDKYLSLENKDLSRSYIKKLINDNKIFVNGQKAKASCKLRDGDQIKLVIPEAKELELEPYEIKLDILYEDQDLIVLNKPPGLIVHPVKGNYQKTLVNALLAYTDNLSGINGVKRPGIVHRLDKDTSGALLVAKNNISHQNLVKQFKRRKIEKNYFALVKGCLKHNKGTIKAPIGRDPDDRKRMAVTPDNSKKAVTHFEVIAYNNNLSLVKIKLETGRTHQIRVHFSYIGHSLLGDNKYGKKNNKSYIKRQMLHAYQLKFKHPIKDKKMEVAAPLPVDFNEVLNKYNLSIY